MGSTPTLGTNTMTNYIINLLQSKALKSSCVFKVSAVALDRKGTILGTAVNNPRFNRYHGSIHAEHKLIIKYGKQIKQIIIGRVGRYGTFLPISPCAKCSKMAMKLGIKILSIGEKHESN